MDRTTLTARVGCLAILLVGCSQVAAQGTTASWPRVTEQRRQEIMSAADALTRVALPELLQRANAGDVEAQVLAALVYDSGKVVESDLAEAVRWMQAAAASHHPVAQNMLGMRYDMGRGLPQDSQLAVAWLTKSAAQEYAQAQSNLGLMLFEGRGTAASPTEAVRLFRLAADQGNTSGQCRLGIAYALGKGVVLDKQQAVFWYRKAAEGGDVNAQLNLAKAYNFGFGVPRDLAEAAIWYRKAAEQGNTTAQVDLAVAYINGEGVRKDRSEAEKWLKQASEKGSALGSFYFGRLYLREGGSLAGLVAVDKFRLSSQQGYPVAAFTLGQLHAARFGPQSIGKDDVLACTWYTIASDLDKRRDWGQEQPDDVAKMRRELPTRIERIRKSLGSVRSAECESRAADWIAKHLASR